MLLVAPDDVKLISNLTDEFSDYLLNKERLDKFLNTFDLTTAPTEKEVTSLMKRCFGMKILIAHIQKYGEKFLKLFEPKYTEQLLNELLPKCIDKKETKDELSLDWYEQKLFVIKRLATESRNSLEPSMNISLEEMKTEQDVDFINDISKIHSDREQHKLKQNRSDRNSKDGNVTSKDHIDEYNIDFKLKQMEKHEYFTKRFEDLERVINGLGENEEQEEEQKTELSTDHKEEEY